MISLSGNIIRGKGVGRDIGFRTANLDCRKEDINLEYGVYAVRATVKDNIYNATLTIMNNPWSVEVYLINFENNDIYGEYMVINIVGKISEIEICESTILLQKKIKLDIKKAIKILA